jgi:Protein of unknown function (DUF732)
MLGALTVRNPKRAGGGQALQAVTRWCKNHVVMVGLLALLGGGCGGAGNNSRVDATATSAPAARAGPGAFLAEARAMTFGSKDLAAASDADLLRVGRLVCDGLGHKGLDFGRVVQTLLRSAAHPTTAEATALAASAVGNLCPWQASAIPG